MKRLRAAVIFFYGFITLRKVSHRCAKSTDFEQYQLKQIFLNLSSLLKVPDSTTFKNKNK